MSCDIIYIFKWWGKEKGSYLSKVTQITHLPSKQLNNMKKLRRILLSQSFSMKLRLRLVNFIRVNIYLALGNQIRTMILLKILQNIPIFIEVRCLKNVWKYWGNKKQMSINKFWSVWVEWSKIKLQERCFLSLDNNKLARRL